ncbi:lipopolysaccharide biosynthesis protein [candidate division WOR-3 bacterium]|nr:lipopolysaccharide biosynthesis protein [candidate division WOR-3 bacterium]
MKQSSTIAEEPLKNKVVKGAFWVFTSQIATQLLAFAKNIIIARVLSPNDFGLFGVALIALSLFDVSFRTGFNAALIQKKENIEEYLDTAFVINIIRGFILFVLLLFSAPVISIFFKNEAVIPVIRVISFNFLINGFVNPGTVYFVKELNFKKQFYWDASKIITDVVVVISIVFLLRNVWVLVVSSISSYLVRMVVSYFINSFRPKFRFKKEYALDLFKFGKWVLFSNVLVYLITQGDSAFVGRTLEISILGLYKMAYTFSNIPTTQISNVIAKVSYPAYSKIQDNIQRLRDAYLRILQITTLLSIPFTGFIFILAPDFTRLFLGAKWMPMVPAMQILVFAGLIRSIAATTGVLFYAVGKPKIDTVWQIIRLCVLAILIYPFTIKWGISGTSIAVFLSIFISNIGFSLMAIKIAECTVKKFLATMIPPLVSGIISVLIVFGLKNFIGEEIRDFIVVAFVGVLIYIFITFLAGKYFNSGYLGLIKESIKTVKRN